MTITEHIERFQKQIAEARKRIDWLKANEQKLADLPEMSSGLGDFDFDQLSHEDVIRVIKALGGTWDKTLSMSGDRVNYVANFDGVEVACFKGEPPPSCKVVEVEEIIPAQPERKMMVRKLVCKEPTPLLNIPDPESQPDGPDYSPPDPPDSTPASPMANGEWPAWMKPTGADEHVARDRGARVLIDDENQKSRPL